jgi:UDP-3-O-[3-hydroxymyristoyl] glucosamine N-acyltransferase LpxD
MFTGNTISFRQFAQCFDLQLLRDCDFAYVSKIPSRLERRIVPCSKSSHISEALASSGIVGIITTSELCEQVPAALGLAISENPVAAAMALHEHISIIPDFQWKSFKSQIHPSAIIHRGAYVADTDVVIGEGSVIHPNSIILPRSIIGKNCSIGPGTVVSTDAFEINLFTSPHRILRQSGGVRMANNVDVQAKCTLVRATFGGFTELGQETKIDCQVHFAHDCITGKRVRIAACAELSGRVEIGDDCFIGPNVSISNGIKVGSRSKVTIGSVVTRDVTEDTTVTGNFAVEHKKWLNFVRSLK